MVAINRDFGGRWHCDNLDKSNPALRQDLSDEVASGIRDAEDGVADGTLQWGGVSPP